MTVKKRIKSLLGMIAIIVGIDCVLLALTYYLPLISIDILRQEERTYIERTTYRPALETAYFNDPQTLALCRALKDRNIKEARRAIRSGANVNAKGKDDVSLLQWAFPCGEEVLELLLANGADPNVEYSEAYSELYDYHPSKYLLQSALNYKVGDNRYYDNYPSLFLKYGADPNLLGNRVLSWVASSEQLRGDFYQLVDAGADPNPADKFPVVDCLGVEDFSIYLLEHGAIYDVNTPQGAALQRRLYELTETRDGRLAPMSSEARESIEKTRKWLEAHGVSFDNEAPRVK